MNSRALCMCIPARMNHKSAKMIFFASALSIYNNHNNEPIQYVRIDDEY